MPFFVIFIGIPLIEIALFITVGGQIGVAATLLIALATAILGGFIFRYQGIRTFQKAAESMGRAEFPAKELFDGFCLVIAAALLVTPGFFTDALGFTLLVPRARDAFRSLARRHIDHSGGTGFYAGPFGSSGHSGPRPEEPAPGEAIDVEYEKVDERDAPGKEP